MSYRKAVQSFRAFSGAFCAKSLVSGTLLGAIFLSLAGTAAAATFTITALDRGMADSAIGSAQDIGYWVGPPDSTNSNDVGVFNHTYTVTSPSAYFSLDMTVSHNSNVSTNANGTDSAILVARGELACSATYIGSDLGGASANDFANMDLQFYCDESFAYTLAVTNSGAFGGYGRDGLVTFWDQIGLVDLEFTNIGVQTVTGILPAGGYRLRALSEDALDGSPYNANRATSFSFIASALPQPVTLNIAQTNNGVVLWWPQTAAGYQLIATDAVTNSIWDTVTNLPTPVGDQYQVLLSPASGTRFFRLRK